MHQYDLVRKTLMAVGWLGATAATTLVAYLAVDAAGSSVSDTPLATMVAADAGSTTLAPGSTATVTTTDPTSTSTTSVPSTPTSTTTSVTADPTITAPAWQQQTINSAAGKVIVSYRSGEVRLESVAPLAGFSFEVDDAGPPEVRVEFEGPVRVEIRVRWRDGQLVTEIDEDN
ncbi:MAG TPA: hypothetical protein VFT54_07095 [Acidimicrobiia bacterium]|nr:hypothetical protein [Acidimicrobiia bacterium]